jgi:DNA-binding response OmpR family regulator
MEMDEVKGITMGADDFLTKPFSIAVLRARVNALIRRSRISQGNNESLVYTLDDMTFDFEKSALIQSSSPSSPLHPINTVAADTINARPHVINKCFFIRSIIFDVY